MYRCYDYRMVVIKCKKCNIEKPKTDFRLWRARRNAWCTKCRARNNDWYSQDKDGRKTKAKLYYKRIKHKVAQYRSDLRLERKYKLTREEWNRMLALQKNLCGLCTEEMKFPCVDHCHQTGEVRGLLHRECNLKLQSIEDTEFLSKAHVYLESKK